MRPITTSPPPHPAPIFPNPFLFSYHHPDPDVLHYRQGWAILAPLHTCPTPRPSLQPNSLRKRHGWLAPFLPERAMASSWLFPGSARVPSGVGSNAEIRAVDGTFSSSSTSGSCSRSGPCWSGPTPCSHSLRSLITAGSLEALVTMKKKCFRSAWTRSGTLPMFSPIGSVTRCWYDRARIFAGVPTH